MILQEKDKDIKYLFDFFYKKPQAIVKMVFKNLIIEKAQMDTMYENDDDFDEYNIILIRNLDDNTLIEVSYHNKPISVYYKGKKL